MRIDAYWTPIGRLLDVYWTSIGRLLDAYWTPIGRLFDAARRLLFPGVDPGDQ